MSSNSIVRLFARLNGRRRVASAPMLTLALVMAVICSGDRSVTKAALQDPLIPSELIVVLQQKRLEAAALTRTESALQRFETLANDAQQTGIVPVIAQLRVVFRPEGEMDNSLEAQAQRLLITQLQGELLSTLSGYDPASVKQFQYLPLMAMRVNAAGIESLRVSSSVIDIFPDRTSSLELSRSVPLIGATTAWAQGYTGAGQSVAIIDTGVDKNHPFLASKVVSEACYSTNDSNLLVSSICPGRVSATTAVDSALPCDLVGASCEHGTHVAGIAAGKGNSFSGVARDATVIAIKVFSKLDNPEKCFGITPCLVAYDSDIIRSLERLFELRNTYKIAAANLSLGGSRFPANCDSSAGPVKVAIDQLRSVGIATVAASGNNSYTNAISHPACVSTAVSVGSTTNFPGQTDQVSSFSNSASFLNLLAPGEAITSSIPGGEFASYTGTSMAAPHVAGAWAIAKQKVPQAGVSDILTALTTTGPSIIDLRNGIRKPRIQIDAALASIGDGDPQAPAAPSNLTATLSSPSQVDLTWTDNSSNESGFRIRRKIGAFGSWAVIATVGPNSTTFQNTSVGSGFNFYYKVTAYNSFGDSADSNEVNVTTPISPPGAPTSLRANPPTSTRVTLSWNDNSTNETGFRIRRRLGANGTWSVVGTVAQNSLTYQDTGLLSRTTYQYAVFAYNGAGESPSSNEIQVTTLEDEPQIPPAPSNLVASVSSGTQVSLRWIDNSTNETGFRIRRRTGTSGSWIELPVLPANTVSFVDSSLTPGVTYFYTVSAFNGNGESSVSNESNATLPDQLPAAPSNLELSFGTAGQIALRWTDNSTNELGFKIRRRTGAGGVWADLMLVDPNTQSYFDSSVVPGSTYFYVVLAFNGIGDSRPSNEVSITVPAIIPDAPGNLRAVTASASVISLTWNDNSQNETGFRIRRRTGSGGTWSELATVSQNATNYQDRNIVAGTTYFYTVAAFSGSGESAQSNEASATALPSGTPPQQAGNLQASALSASQIELRWIDNSTNETGFRIRRRPDTNSQWSDVGSVGVNISTWVDNGLAPGTSMIYCVVAFNSSGESPSSNEVVLSTPTEAFLPLLNGQTVSGSVARNRSAYYRINVPIGSIELFVQTGGSGNTDLYLRNGIQPQLTAFDCRSINGNTSDLCRIGSPAPGDWHILVYGYSNGTSTFTLKADVAPGPGVSIPFTPINLQATAVSGSQVSLRWEDKSNNEARFRIRRRILPNGPWSEIASVGENVTTFQNTGLIAGVTYSYSVTAVSSAGESAGSNEAVVTPQGTSTPPNAPGNLRATAISATQVSLTWTDNSQNEAGFRVRRRTASGGFAEVASLGANITSWQDTSVVPDVTYGYVVIAFNNNGDSPASAEASVTTSPIQEPPGPPSGLRASVISPSQISIAWNDNSSNETGFRIRRRVGSGSLVDLTTVPANTTSFTDIGLTAETTYGYVVSALSSNGESLPSNEAVATTPPIPIPPTAPSGLRASAITSSQMALVWNDNSQNETGFRLRRRVGSGAAIDIATLPANTTSFTDSGLTAETTYSYVVIAFNGNGDSSPSNESSSTTPAVPTAPTAPSALRTSAASPSQINLVWTDNSQNETGFRVRRRFGSGALVDLTTLPANTISFTDNGLTAETTYSYVVIAFNSVGDSSPSNESSATTPAVPTAPTAPSALRASAISPSQINLVWTDNSSNETGFRLRRRTGSGVLADIATLPAGITSFTDNGLAAETTYSYVVIAFNGNGDSLPSNEASATTPAVPGPPVAPSGLQASAISPSQITLTWTDNSLNENGFRIRRRTGSGAFADIASVPANITSFTDTGLAAETTYRYIVIAFNGNGDSSSSNESSSTTPAVPVPPVAPSGLQASAISPSQIAVTWTDNSSNETGFRLRRRTGSGAFANIASLPAGTTSFTDTGLSGETTYSYVVIAFNVNGDSSPSNEASVTTPAPPPTPPTAPTGLRAALTGRTQITLNWTDGSSNETGFRIRRRTLLGTAQTVSTVGANATTYTDNDVSANTTYVYTIIAFNSGGESASSNEASITIPDNNIPSAPSNLTATSVSPFQINLSWSDNSGNETGFSIRRRNPTTGQMVEIATVSRDIVLYQDSGLTPGTAYTYSVRAYNANGESAFSNEATATTSQVVDQVPEAPGSLSVLSSSPWHTSLRWTDQSDNELGFRVLRAVGLRGGFTVVATVDANTNTYRDGGLRPGVSYFYVVRAFNNTGESASSNKVGATTASLPLETVVIAPPENLSVTSISGTEAYLSWDDSVNGETGFRVLRWTGNSSTPTVIATLGADTHSYIDKNLVPGTSYVYSIVAFNANNESAPSNECLIIAPMEEFTPLGNGMDSSGIIYNNQTYLYRINVPVGALQLQVQSIGSGNIDLYVRSIRQPNLSNFECRSASGTSAESCQISLPTPGDWYIMVHGNSTAASSFTLRANFLMGTILVPLEEPK